MTTINDRLEKLEDAFVELTPALKELERLREAFAEITPDLRELAVDAKQSVKDIIGMLVEVARIQREHTELLQTVVSALNTQSTDLTIVKEYLG